ncbi:MAG: hypothetical protein KC621_02900 [Myxococcales bacterium]|nr:hypothetical protein [Myxococcales bacterium]
MRWFLEGGPAMWLILLVDVGLLGLLGLGAVGAIATRIARVGVWPARFVTLLVLLGVGVPVLAGVAGWWMSMSQVEAALQMAEPSMRGALRDAGEGYARIPLFFGGGSSGLLVVPAVIAAGIAWAPSRAPTDDDDD